MAVFTRRELVSTFAGLAARGALRADDAKALVSGVDHLKLRVANSGASMMFYYGLFGGEIIAAHNSTLPDTPLVNEFFLKIGAPRFPYLVFAQVRADELPGLDHISFLVSDSVAIRSSLEHHGVPLMEPGQWFRDADSTLVELMPSPTFGIQAQSIRLALPMNLRGLRPAFDAAAVTRFCLRSHDVARSVDFLRKVFAKPSIGALANGAQAFLFGHTVLEIRPIAGMQNPGLERIGVGIHGVTLKQARRILEQRGIQPRGSKDEVLFRDPDGNELQLIAL